MSTDLTLYFDRSLGKALPEALRLLKVPNVIHHHTPPEIIGLRRRASHNGIFPEDAPDDDWLSFVGKRGWTAFSQDYKMHREPAPLAAIRQHNVKVFYLWGAESSRWEKMRVFARAYDKIIEVSNSQPGPFVKRITKTGMLEDVI